MQETDERPGELAAGRRTLILTLAFFVPALPLGAAMLVRESKSPPPPRRCRGWHPSCAVGSMRAYASAQSMYIRNDWDGDGRLEYAASFTRLYEEKDSNGVPIQLIDQVFAEAEGLGGKPKQGYLFQDMKTIGGKPIDWKKDFALCAIPATYDRDGRCTLIVSKNGTVWCKDLGAGKGFVQDYPLDPNKAGWCLAE
jgi:hypothetical protein